MEDNDEITTDKAFILMMRRTALASTKIDTTSIKYRNGVMIFIIDCGAEVHAFPTTWHKSLGLTSWMHRCDYEALMEI